MFLSEHVIIHLFSMDELIPVIFFQLSASLRGKVKPNDIWCGCIWLDKLSANKTLASWDYLVSHDFCVHHDGIVEVDTRNRRMKDIGIDGLCPLVFNLFQKSLIGDKRLHLNDSIFSVDHGVAVIIQENSLRNGKFEIWSCVLIIGSALFNFEDGLNKGRDTL